MIGKLIGYIIGAYVLYYAANVIYDLYLAKEKKPKEDDDGEVINLGNLVTHNNDDDVANVYVEEVEIVSVPDSYNGEESVVDYQEENLKTYDTSLQNAYEEEESFAFIEAKQMEEANEDLNKASKSIKEVLHACTQSIISEKKELVKTGSELLTDWNELMQSAQTKIAMVSNNNGHKVFKSTF